METKLSSILDPKKRIMKPKIDQISFVVLFPIPSSCKLSHFTFRIARHIESFFYSHSSMYNHFFDQKRALRFPPHENMIEASHTSSYKKKKNTQQHTDTAKSHHKIWLRSTKIYNADIFKYTFCQNSPTSFTADHN